MYRVYYKDAFGAVLVFDLSREETFTNVLKWKREIDSKVTLPNGKPLPVVLLANKCDLPEATVQREALDGFCKEHGFIGWFDTSAKTNHNIEEGVRALVSSILAHPGERASERCEGARGLRVEGISRDGSLAPPPPPPLSSVPPRRRLRGAARAACEQGGGAVGRRAGRRCGRRRREQERRWLLRQQLRRPPTAPVFFIFSRPISPEYFGEQ